jgi:hypothetical protein
MNLFELARAAHIVVGAVVLVTTATISKPPEGGCASRSARRWARTFAATHASFTILGLGAVLPAVKEPWTRTAIITSWMIAAGIVRWRAGRRFMGRPLPAAPVPTATLAAARRSA